jgi:signal transduction histidine kinase
VVTGRVAAPDAVSRGAQRPRWADPRLPFVLLPAVVVVAILAELSLANAGVSTDGILTDAASGMAFSLAGLIAWRRRPENRVGPIMTGIGLAWFGGDFLYGPVPIVGPLSFLAQVAARILFAWLLLAFPSGRLGSSLHRWAVGLIAGLAGALAVFQLVTLDPATICPCPTSPFSFAADWPAAAELENASAAVGMGMTLILVPLVVRRIVVASAPARRSLLPVLAGGAFSLLSVTPDLVSRLSGTAPEPISWLPIVWVALPLGFLLVLLDARMARAGVADLILDLDAAPEPIGSQAVALPANGADGAASPHVTSGPGQGTTVAVGLLGIAAAASLVAMSGEQGGDVNPALLAFLGCWVSLSYVVAGMVAWRRRPESRQGPLMVTAGFATYLNFLIWSSNDLLYTLGWACQFLPPVLFLHVFLAYPHGVLRSRLDRMVVLAAYGTAALSVPGLLLGLDGDRNRIALLHEPELADLLLHAQLLLTGVLMLAGIGILVRRRLLGDRPLRRTFSWLIDAFAIGLLLIALLMAAVYFAWAAPVQDPLRLSTFFVIGLAPFVFMFGLLQVRLDRASVGDFLVEMGSNPGPIRLEQAAARALRDPSVSIAYWLDDLDEYADANGKRIDLTKQAGRSVTPVERDGVLVAALVHDAALDDEPQLLHAVAHAIGMAIENSQLQVELQARLADVQASRARIVTAGDVERRRLERDLHDGAQQRLVALSLALRRAQGRAGDATDPALSASLEDAAALVREALDELRELARGLHPAILSEAGLPGAIAALGSRSPVPVTVLEVPDERLAPEVEAGAYFFVSEALANVAKHAPRATVTVRIARDAERLTIEVSDDGPGGASPGPGSGLQGLEDRMAAAGGGFQVRSPVGAGTHLRGWLPLGAGAA